MPTEEPATSNPTEPDDDTISLTSTHYDEESPDQEYLVEDILSEEGSRQDGDPIYLVKWTGYPLEKCTWEPKEFIDDGLLEHLWEAKRRRPDFQPFDYNIIADAVKRKMERHFRRNRVRQRRNLPLTEPIDAAGVWMGPELPIPLEDMTPEPPSSEGTERRSESHDVEMTDAPTDAAIYIADDGKDTLNPLDDDLIVLDELSSKPNSKKKKKKKKKTSTTELNVKMDTKDVKDAKDNKAAKKPKDSKGGKDTKDTSSIVVNLDDIKSPAPKKSNMPAPTTAASGKPEVAASKKPAQRKASGQLSGLSIKAGATVATSPAPDTQKRTFSARKSGLAYGANSGAVNVFSGGKKTTRSKRENKPDYYFPNFSLRHRAEMKSRQMEDREIDPKKISTLFPIGQPVTSDKGRRASAASQGHEAQAQNGGQESPGEAQAQDGGQGSPGDVQVQSGSRSGSMPTSTPPPSGVLVHKKTKKKSVRFSAGEEESGPSIECGATTSVGHVLNEGVVFLEPEQLSQATQAVLKKLSLGEQGRPIEAKITGVPLSERPNPVVQAFVDEELLLFGHTCLAVTFQANFGMIRQDVLFSGGIKGVSPVPAAENDNVQALLDTAAERLRVAASCLVFARPAYFVVLYPVRSDDWKDGPFGSPLRDDDANCVLRYLAFSTPYDYTPFLQPSQNAAPPWDQDATQKITDRVRLMKAFFGLDWNLYRSLLPRNSLQKHVKRNFFLVFPSLARHQMALWLRALDPHCVLFVDVNRGAWMAFQEKVMDMEVGVVLVHETAVWTLRRFPGLADLVLADSKNCKIWAVSQSVLSPPLFPSPSPKACTTVARPSDQCPGRMRLTQLFHEGLAFLMTPSFIVTEPQRTFALLQWFCHWRQLPPQTLMMVTPPNFCDYLRRVADEKARQREKFLDSNDTRPKSDRDAAAHRMGIDEASCEDHYKAWLLATEICASRQTRAWGIYQAEDIFDSNDEQSLVNWFGLFCTAHMDRYRSFYVVGSNMAIKTRESARGRCRIQLPRFAPGTVGNPDDYRHDILDTKRDPQLAALAAPAAVIRGPAAPPPPNREVFTWVFNDHLRMFYGSKAQWKVYGFPVLWKDGGEAFDYGRMEYSNTTIAHWFNYTWPFGPIHKAYIALFYPVDKEVQSSLAWDRRPRHPWLVVFRPVKARGNNHRQFDSTELVFWDPRAKKRLRGRRYLRQTDLTETQQAVVEHVVANGHLKNENMPLQAVYIGGPSDDAPANADEFAITMERLEALGYDYFASLPPQVSKYGYRRVYMTAQSPPKTGTDDWDNGDGGITDFAAESRSSSMEPDNTPLKIVFHPPRADAGVLAGNQEAAPNANMAPPKQRSRCNNDLFLCAQRVLEEKPDAATFMYEFRPTMDWYGEQEKEGRGFGHVRVSSWEAFFNNFRIEAGANADESQDDEENQDDDVEDGQIVGAEADVSVEMDVDSD